MNIGILTYYRVNNFGANLQALSTYRFFKSKGLNPIFIHYMSKKLYETCNDINNDIQKKEHIDFIDNYIENQSDLCYNANDVIKVIKNNNIKAIVIGSDAVVQHHSLIERIKKGKRKPIFIQPISKDRIFPNIFWGVGIPNDVKLIMMSVSSQNSRYKLFSQLTKFKMKKSLCRFNYISARDTWTANMFKSILNKKITVTPDPVFAFNYNCSDLIPSFNDIIEKYKLPSKYILICLKSQALPISELQELKIEFQNLGLTCIAFPISTGIKFSHPFDYEIQLPLSPIDWYALIKYSSGYIGGNMHPIIVSLHNSVPCVSFDDYINYNFFGKAIKDKSSKIEHIMEVFNLNNTNLTKIENEKCNMSTKAIVNAILNFPKDNVTEMSKNYYSKYLFMMNEIISILK